MGLSFFRRRIRKIKKKTLRYRCYPGYRCHCTTIKISLILDTVCVCNNTVYTNMYLYINKLASPSKYICSTHACTYSSMSTDQDQTNRTTETQ